jgi:hypothetical protein
MMPFFSGKRRARERFESAACVARSTPRRETRRSVIARAERAPEATERVRRVCPNRSRARVWRRPLRRLLAVGSKRESVSLFFSRNRRAARRSVGSFFNVFHGAPEARLSQIGSRAGRARQGRRGSSPRRGRRRHVARVSTRASARRGSPEPRAAFRLASRSPARLDPLPPSSNLRPVEICAIPLSTSPR